MSEQGSRPPHEQAGMDISRPPAREAGIDDDSRSDRPPQNRRWQERIAPPRSIRAQFLTLAGRAGEVLNTQGAGAVTRRTLAALDRYRRTGSLILPQKGVVEPPAYSYAEWMRDFEPGPEGAPQTLLAQQDQVASLAYRPIISFITPVYNPPVAALASAIDSVVAQSYPHWTLCLVDGASTEPEVRATLERRAAQDPRIRLLHLSENLGISGNSNLALQLADGEFVALLDHDDMLAPDMLFEVAQLLNRTPDADILYFDEDKLSVDGLERYAPWFKPDWSPDLMLSTNLLMHGVFRRALVEKVGGFNPEMDGAQDWDLALRCTERTSRIYHIPRVLYHWRAVPGSAAGDAAAKPWAIAAQARAIPAHLRRLGVQDTGVEFPTPGTVHLRWPPPAGKVSIIIPTKDKANLLAACVASILEKSTCPDFEIIVVDTGSQEQATLELYRSLELDPRVRFVEYEGQFNWSRANNLGATQARGDFLLFLNNDTEVIEPGWLEEMAGWAARPQTGVVGAKLLRPNGMIQHAGIVMGLAGHGSHIFEDSAEGVYGIFGSPEWVRNYRAVTGACMMVRREIFDELQGFDELYRIGYSDIEFCLRAVRAGYRNVYAPFARLVHHEGGSRGFNLPASDVLRASCQLLPWVQSGDPYFNPNLSYHYRQPRLAELEDLPPAAGLVRVQESLDLVPPGLSPRHEVVTSFWRAPVAWPEARDHTPPPSRDARLLLVTPDLSLSGAPWILANLARFLAQEGRSVTVLASFEGPLRALYEANGVRVVVEPDLGEMLRNSAPMADYVGDYDLIVANTIVAWRAVHMAKAFGRPAILWIHESTYGADLAKQNPAVAAALGAADKVLLPAQRLVSLYQPFLPGERYIVLPHGIDTDLLDTVSDTVSDTLPGDSGAPGSSAPRVEMPRNKICVVQVGSVEPRKGQDFLVQSIAALPEAILQRMEFYLVGRTLDEGFAQALQEMSRGLTNIHFTGEASHAQVMSYLRAADIFVLPSRDEVLPITILEAMYYKKAVIATRVGGVAEAVEHGVGGLLVNFGDKPTLTRYLAELSVDGARRSALGQNAYLAFRHRFSMSRFGAAFLIAVDDVLQGNGSAVRMRQAVP